MKGIPYLLKAFNSIPNNLPIHLLLVGRDMDDRANTKVINQGNKQKHLHLLGFRRDALNIVAASDVFVLPSIKGESITKSVIESMSLGTPAIITDIPGNVELVVNGESGIVVPSKQSKPLAEAILHIYHDKDLRQRLGKNARKHIATKLNHIQTIEKTKAMYQSLVK